VDEPLVVLAAPGASQGSVRIVANPHAIRSEVDESPGRPSVGAERIFETFYRLDLNMNDGA